MTNSLKSSSSTESLSSETLPSSNRHSTGQCSTIPPTNQTAEPVSWYCHNCGFGPMNRQLCHSCIQCGHIGCSKCTRDPPSKQNFMELDSQESSGETTMTTGFGGFGAVKQGLDALDTPKTSSQVWYASDPMAGVQLDGDWIWNCHNCGDGPMGVSTHPACTNCGHQRCKACPLYAS